MVFIKQILLFFLKTRCKLISDYFGKFELKKIASYLQDVEIFILEYNEQKALYYTKLSLVI